MPAVRHTPKRRRMDCPSCGRNISYTHPWVPNRLGFGSDPLMRDTNTLVFMAHRKPDNGPKCDVNGPHDRGYSVPDEHTLNEGWGV